MRRLPKSLLRAAGFELVRAPSALNSAAGIIADLSPKQQDIISLVSDFSLTGADRLAALLNAVEYVGANKIPGDVAECGVWRGGSMMAVALALIAQGDTNRHLYLYDTFEGMSAPTEQDKLVDGTLAAKLLDRDAKGTGIWCYASLEDVQKNMFSTGYPKEKIHFIKGKVEETIPGTIPAHIGLLRLDTDWYESTKHELIHLFPLLDAKGVLILDDYGTWQGAKTAVDEFIREKQLNVFLHRIDASARILIRT
jgi:O-methyltransferase